METFRLSHQRLHLHFLLRWEGKTFESFPWLASDMKEKQVWRNVSWYAYSFWYWKGSDRWSSMILKKKHLLFVVCLCAFWWFWNKDENTCDLSLRLSINLSNLGCRKQQLRKPRLFGRLSESNLFRVSMVFSGNKSCHFWLPVGWLKESVGSCQVFSVEFAVSWYNRYTSVDEITEAHKPKNFACPGRMKWSCPSPSVFLETSYPGFMKCENSESRIAFGFWGLPFKIAVWIGAAPFFAFTEHSSEQTSNQAKLAYEYSLKNLLWKQAAGTPGWHWWESGESIFC